MSLLPCNSVCSYLIFIINNYSNYLRSRQRVRDRSLITGRGGGYKTGGGGGGGAHKVLPLQKGGGGKSFSHIEGVTQKNHFPSSRLDDSPQRTHHATPVF